MPSSVVLSRDDRPTPVGEDHASRDYAPGIHTSSGRDRHERELHGMGKEFRVELAATVNLPVKLAKIQFLDEANGQPTGEELPVSVAQGRRRRQRGPCPSAKTGLTRNSTASM